MSLDILDIHSFNFEVVGQYVIAFVAIQIPTVTVAPASPKPYQTSPTPLAGGGRVCGALGVWGGAIATVVM